MGRSGTQEIARAAMVGAGVIGAGIVAAARKPRATTTGPDVRSLRSFGTRLTTPLLPDDYLSLINPLWSARELRGRVVKVVRETENAATLVIKPGWGWSFDYQAGQYVGIGTQLDGRWHWRSYSLTSAPRRDQGHISVTVKAMPEGFLSGHLVNGLTTGTIVRLAAPQGSFVLPEPPPAKILFLTAGSGMTPVMAMLRTLHRRGTMPDVTMVHSAPAASDVLFRTELHGLVGTYDSFRLHEQHTDTMGLLSMHAIDTVCPDWAERETWACGPPAMLEAAEKLWTSYGIAERLHLERFSVALKGAGGEGGEISFERSNKSTKADGATTLLDAGEQAGVIMPFGCRMGICQSCVVPLKAGSVRDLRTGELKQEGDRIQTCVCAAAGDCVVDV